jgi:hypothetical protein
MCGREKFLSVRFARRLFGTEENAGCERKSKSRGTDLRYTVNSAFMREVPLEGQAMTRKFFLLSGTGRGNHTLL